MPAADEYGWVNDTGLSEAACVTVVPVADLAGVLTAFGADSASRRAGSLDELDLGTGSGGPIYVAQVADAVVVVENNGFQGSRDEVLGPASRATRQGRAGSFFWNVNALTAFSGAEAGQVVFSFEVLGIEEDDDDLDGLPAAVSALLVEGGSDDGDMLAGGLAALAAWTGVRFTPGTLSGGAVYDVRPPTLSLRTFDHTYRFLDEIPDAPTAVAALTPDRQRVLAAWTTAAAVREAGMTSEDPRLLSPAGLDDLARTTAKAHDDFSDLEDQLEIGGTETPAHPYHVARVPAPFGESEAISTLEGDYLGQRRSAVDAARYLRHGDPLSAAIGCLSTTSGVFQRGRTERGWTFGDDGRGGRFRDGTVSNPRHEQFVRVVTGLIADLASTADAYEVCLRANLLLPRPLTRAERRTAVEADALAAARGEFATWQVAPAGLDGEPDGWPPGDGPTFDIDDELGPDGWPKAWGPRPGPSD